MTPLRNDRGVALVMVLLVVTLLSIVIIEFAYTTLVYSHLARNSVNGLQASLLARSGLNLGEAILITDADPQVDSFLEDWCPEPGPSWCRIDESLLPVPGNMRIRIQIVDESGKLNLNGTRPTIREYKDSLTNPDPEVLQSFRVVQVALKKLIEMVGGDPAAADRLDEYWGQLIETRFASAVNGPQAAAGATPGPTPPGGQPQGSTITQADNQLRQINFPSLDDANAILGLDPRVLQRLRRYVTADVLRNGNSGKSLNANTAPRIVLEALFDDPSVVDAIVVRRESAPLILSDLSTTLQEAADPRNPMGKAVGMLGVKSQLYRIIASAIVNPDPVTGEGGLARSASMVVRRTDSAANRGKQGNNGLPAWTLTRLDWQKEGGAVLFEEASMEPGGEPGAEDADRASF